MAESQNKTSHAVMDRQIMPGLPRQGPPLLNLPLEGTQRGAGSHGGLLPKPNNHGGHSPSRWKEAF